MIWIKVTSPGIASKLTAETFRRDDSRVYEVDCRREIGQVSAGQRVAFVTHDVREWGKPRKLKDTRKEDNRPVAEKIAEAEEFAHKLEAEQKLDAFKQRAFAAAMERGQI